MRKDLRIKKELLRKSQQQDTPPPAYSAAMLAECRQELKREIAAAKREAPYALPYKPLLDRCGNPE